MFLNKWIDPRPLGVPLDLLQAMLTAGNQKVRRDGNSLISHNGKFETVIEVQPPENSETQDFPVQAVITIKTSLPKELASMIKGDLDTLNNFAAVGGVYEDEGRLYVGSRLTVFEGEDAWDMQLRLLSGAVLFGTDAITGGFLNVLTGGSPTPAGGEPWTEDEFDQAQEMLSKICVCTVGGLGLTAEFGLEEGAISAAMGHRTALYQIMSDQPHPFLGDGLFCLLQMPNSFTDESALNKLVAGLNRMEMSEEDQPPHFGAWCKSRSGDGVAYVSFLPNALHYPGIHINMAIWAMHRARMIDGMLTEQVG